ncbi:MAG TPA: hypothetical protein VH309_04745, partial [Elusimicrobiota bacterium]|nr:hypothetical protein [Elusimicrobiota bacterium]
MRAKKASRAILWAAFSAALLCAAWPLLAPAPKSDFPIAEFSRLPVLEGGRVKPIDSFARNSLLLIRGTQTLPVEGRTQSAAEWLLDAMFHPEAADTRPVFVIDDPDVLGILGLRQDRERRFAYWQIEPQRDEVGAQAQRAAKIEASRRTRFQSSVIALANRLDLYERIKNTLMISGSDDPVRELAAFSEVLPGALRAVHGLKTASAQDKAQVKALSELLERYRFLAGAAAFRPLPPRQGDADDAWKSFGEGVTQPDGRPPHPGLAAYALMARSYRRSDPAAFQSALSEFTAWVEQTRPADAARARDEV